MVKAPSRSGRTILVGHANGGLQVEELQLISKVSRRAHGVEYAIRDIMVKAEEVRRSGKKILPLNIGDPVKYDFDTPVHIKKALEKAIESGANYYSPSEGMKELREAVAEKENGLNGAHITPDNVLVTTGISEAILFLMGSIVEPGDEVLMPGPCYSPYLAYVKFFDGKAMTYRTIEEHGWAPDIQDLQSKITDRTRLIVIVNPNNPCGSLYSRSELQKILDLAASHGIPVAADEIYDKIIYDGSFTSVASLAKDVSLIGLNGFSKAYLMTGWRLGYLYLQDPEGRLADVWDGIQRLSRVRISASTPVQLAGVEALRGPQDHIRQMVAKLKARRDFSLKRISAIPRMSSATPGGAFYLFPKVALAGTKWKSDEEFVTDLLKDTGVLVVHGSGFDPTYGKDHFRAVFLPDETMLGQAFDAIEGFMKRRT
jgi:tyrosine/nicotianamine family aminotransferase